MKVFEKCILFLNYFLATDPDCWAHITEDHDAGDGYRFLTMTCSVSFTGEWAPVMKWQLEEGPVITAGVAIKTVSSMSVISSLTITVTNNMTGRTFSCMTYFSEDNKPQNINATNVPDYAYTWASAKIYTSR